MKGVIIFLFVFLVSFSFVSASLEKSFSEIDGYITQYDSGEITAPQLIVYIDYSQNKMYGSLSGERQISESEVKKFFEKVNNSRNKGNFKRFEYQKIFQTKDFQIIFYAYPFVRHDREYYESKEDLENSYYIDYQFYSSSSVNSFSSEFENFVTDLKEDLNKKDFNYDKLKSEFSKLRNNFQKESNCEEILKDLGFVTIYKGSRGYIKLDHPDLILEFLVPEKGKGIDRPFPLPKLGVNAVALRFLSFLSGNTIKVKIENFYGLDDI